MATLDLVPQMFLLSIFSEMGSGITGIANPYELAVILDGELKRQEDELGPWVVTWGPATRLLSEWEVAGAKPVAVNTVFVAYSAAERRVAVVIAGTNPYSWFDWIVEDWAISPLVAWGGGLSVPGAAISQGTVVALDVIRTLAPLPGLPGSQGGAPCGLIDHLGQLVAWVGRAVEVVVTGHSLGGAVAPALALELELQKGVWDPHRRATVRAVGFAGPTTGNAAFAASADLLLENRILRIHNSLDTSPLGWSPQLLARVPTVYSPAIPANPNTEALVAYRSSEAEGAVALAAEQGLAGGPYTHVAAAAPALVGSIQSLEISPFSSSYVNFNQQAEYQHVDAYFHLLGIPRHVAYANYIRNTLAPARALSAQTKVVPALAAAAAALQ